MEKKIKIYKFKNVKHSVFMKLIKEAQDGKLIMENTNYKGLMYIVTPDEVEEVSDDRN